MEKAQQILECLRNHIDILEKYGLTSDDLKIAHIAVLNRIFKRKDQSTRVSR
jgi:hypothetical protein